MLDTIPDGLPVGHSETSEELITTTKVAAMRALLDRGSKVHAGDPLPPLWHWIFCAPLVPQRDLPPSGDPLDLFSPDPDRSLRSRRSSDITIVRTPRVGEPAARTSHITAVEDSVPDGGRTVTVVHEFMGLRGINIREEQQITYGDRGEPPATGPDRRSALWARVVTPTPTMLFRYAALTFDSARIHFDPLYCARLGYPGVVIDDKLVTTLLADLVTAEVPDERIARFRYATIAPLFGNEPFTLNGFRTPSGAVLWAARHDGTPASHAEIWW